MFKWFSVDPKVAEKIEIIVETHSPKKEEAVPQPVTMYKSKDGKHYETHRDAEKANQYFDLMCALSIFKNDSYHRYGMNEYLSDSIVAYRLMRASKDHIRNIIRALLPYAED